MLKPRFTTSIISEGQKLLENPIDVIHSSICSKSTINKVIPLLIGVVEEGTAKNINSDNYKIAGKTGTAVLNYADRKEGEAKMYQASFVGFFPADNPKYSCIVVINNPKTIRFMEVKLQRLFLKNYQIKFLLWTCIFIVL